MKKPFLIFALVLVLLPSLFSAISPAFYQTEVNWLSYEEARAMKSDKPIFVFAKMRFCATCAAMEKNVFTSPELANMLNKKFIPVKETINFALSSFVFDDLKDKNGAQLEFRGFPAVMLVKGDDYSLEHGYKTKEQLQSMLENANDEV